MPRPYKKSMISWTDEMDFQLISLVQSDSKVYEGIKNASLTMEISLDSVRNRWYGKHVKKKLGINIVVARKKDKKHKHAHQRDDSDNEQDKIQEIEIQESSIVVKESKESIIVKEEIKEYLHIEPPTSPITTKIKLEHKQLKINSDVTKEAKDAITDFKITLELMVDSLNCLLRSNSDLIRELENTKINHNDILRDHTELNDSYSHMLKMLNHARIIALQEEDKNSMNSSKRKFIMDTNGNLNPAG